MNRVIRIPEYTEINCSDKPLNEQSQIWAKYFKDREDSIVTDLFEGQYSNVLKCKQCGASRRTFNKFMDLPVPIPETRHWFSKPEYELSECLEQFTEPELLKNIGYRCSDCHCEDCVVKTMSIFRFPKILVIHLKRF